MTEYIFFPREKQPRWFDYIDRYLMVTDRDGNVVSCEIIVDYHLHEGCIETNAGHYYWLPERYCVMKDPPRELRHIRKELGITSTAEGIFAPASLFAKSKPR